MTTILNDRISAKIEPLSGHRAMLGEGPLWDWRTDKLLWVDILGGETCAFDFADQRFSTQIHATPLTCIGLAAGGGYVATTYRALCRLDGALRIQSVGAEMETDLPGNRFNDGKVDPLGRLWAGTMDAEAVHVSGSLYRFGGSEVCRIDGDYGITNGPAFSLDGRRAYHADSHKRIIYALELNSKYEITSRQPFITFGSEMGIPDGMTVDAAGRLYVAHFGGARISRWQADGGYDGQISLPALNVTSICFGGPSLNTLFATSARVGDEKNSVAGATFRIALDAIGRQEPLFGQALSGE